MKKATIYITIAVVLLALFLYNRKKPYLELEQRQSPPPNNNDLANAFQEVKNNYGQEFAKRIEQLFRYETRHFESKQFLEGYSPGMVAKQTTYPFGWSSLDEFNRANSIDGRKYKIGRVFVKDGKTYRYVVFPNFETSLKFVTWFIRNKRGGVVQKWNSLDEAKSQEYFNTLKTITTQFT